MTIGERIKRRRIELGLSVDELAKKLGKNRATIYRYESGSIKDLPMTILDPLANALMTSPADLMGYMDQDDVKNSEHQESYYIDPETAELAQKLLTDSNYRILFDAARDSRPEDMQMVADLLRRFKEERR